MTDKLDVTPEITEDGTEKSLHVVDDSHIPVQWVPVGGATTLEGAMSFLLEREKNWRIQELFDLFFDIQNNIINSPDIPMTNKPVEMGRLISELTGELRRVADEKSVLTKVKDRLISIVVPETITVPEIVHDSGGSIALLKSTKDDSTLWMSVVSNNFRDRDIPAQIISQAAHKEYVEYLRNAELGNNYPELLLWHTPALAIGKSTWALENDGFLIMGGYIYPGLEKVANTAIEHGWDGMSHGFIPLEHDLATEVIHSYRTFEVSMLPKQYAANIWTSNSLQETL